MAAKLIIVAGSLIVYLKRDSGTQLVNPDVYTSSATLTA